MPNRFLLVSGLALALTALGVMVHAWFHFGYGPTMDFMLNPKNLGTVLEFYGGVAIFALGLCLFFSSPNRN